MGPFGDGKKKKSWQRLSFGRQQTKTGALEQERATSRRILRLGLVSFHVLFVTALIIVDRFKGETMSPEARIDQGLELFGMVVIVHVVMFLLVRSFHPEILVAGPRFRQFFLLIAFSLAVARLLLFQEWVPAYFVPFPLLAMTLALIYNGRVAVHAMGAVLIMFGMMVWTDAGYFERIGRVPIHEFPEEINLVVAQFIGCLVAILGVHRIRTRTRLVTIGLISGFAQSFTILLLSPDKLTSLSRLGEFALQGDAGWGLLNGITAGILVTSALPYIERLFDVTTDMRLIELADTNRPLLHQFSLLAPGSFQHSLMVGQLAEEAAGSIQANALLARVGALYHDVGKMMKPLYFVENMTAGENIHDRLSPEMSRLVVISHVKDGLRIVREEKLPKPIIDMIPMHHGTSVVEFFFNKKMRQSQNGEDCSSDEQKDRTREAFRYPGPKPTFREAGILMLADSVEASSRVLSEPTPARIRQHVRKIIQLRMAQGELDDCELTMRDLGKIEDAFVRVLAAIHHGRIKYPEEEGGAKTAAPPSKSSGDGNGSGSDPKKAPEIPPKASDPGASGSNGVDKKKPDTGRSREHRDGQDGDDKDDDGDKEPVIPGSGARRRS